MTRIHVLLCSSDDGIMVETIDSVLRSSGYAPQFEVVAAEGRRLWTSPEIGTNGVACAQCHPNGANTHPETYPKFQKQLGRVIQLWEMINWCIRNPLEGEELAADDPRMIAMQAYVYKERRGVKLDPGKH